MERTLYCYAYVEAPFDDVSHELALHAARIMQRATDESAEQAGSLSRTLRVAVGGFEVSRDVRIQIGDFEPRAVTRSVVPLRWQAEKGRLLFPSLTAELEVAAIVFDPPLTQLSVSGTYEPPLGVLGAGADRLLLHRLAEATLHRFTHEVADELRRRLEAREEFGGPVGEGVGDAEGEGVGDAEGKGVGDAEGKGVGDAENEDAPDTGSADAG